MAEPVRKSESTNIVWWNQLKNAVIHTHQNLLYFLEIATIVTSSSQIHHYSDLTIKAKTQAGGAIVNLKVKEKVKPPIVRMSLSPVL